MFFTFYICCFIAKNAFLSVVNYNPAVFYCYQDIEL